MKSLLHKLINDQSWAAQLEALATGAPASAPISISRPLAGTSADWLSLLPENAPFWYRARPQQGEFRLGIGHALHLGTAGSNRFAALDNAFQGLCQEWRHEGSAYAFAGFAFDPETHDGLPNALLAIPSILLTSINGQNSVTLTIPAARRDQARATWLELIAQPAIARPVRRLPGRPETLAEQAWMARVRAALREIEKGTLDKLVLSRQRSIQASAPFSATTILRNLIDCQPDSLIYAHGQGEQTFLGASPERLLRLQNGAVEADALAGTAWAESPSLSDPKNRHEQSLVVDAIIDALAPLCQTRPQAGAPTEHPAGQLRHLRSRISARIKEQTTLFDLVRALHPTPAVGGFPGPAARHWLKQHGERRPSWYSGAFGLLDSNGEGEFSVALRSAQINGCMAEFHAGAGIVAGSDPQQELAETEAKLSTLLSAFAAPETPPLTGTLHD